MTIVQKGASYSPGPTLVDMALIANGGGHSWTTGITATLGGRDGALSLSACMNFIDGTSGVGSGVALPRLTGGQLLYAFNRSGSDITIWAATNTTDTIIDVGTSDVLPAGTSKVFLSVADGWVEWIETSSESGGPFLPLAGNATVTGPVTFSEIIPARLNLGSANGNGLAVTLSGQPDHTTSPIWENYYFGGSNSSAANQNFNTIVVQDQVTYTGAGQSNALLIQQYSGAQATRAGGLWVEVDQTAAPTSPWRASTAITGASTLSYNCGGTALTPTGVNGYTTTLSTYTSAGAGATFLQGIVGYEMDLHALAGSSLGGKTGLFIVLLPDDAVSGSFGGDSAIAFGAAGPTHGWDYMLSLGGGSGQIPYKSTATLIGCLEPQTPSTGQALAAWGIDFSRVVFSGGFARSLGFSVDGSGNVTSQQHNIGNWTFTPSSTGLAVDAPSQRSSLTSIAAGGGGFTVGDKVTTAYGGVYQVTAVSAGVATSVTQLVPGASASPPANPVTTTPTNTSIWRPSASGLTLNLAWTAANGLRINPTIGFNGSTPVAKPTVTGAKGGNAALGSLLSALAAYGLITDSTTA